MEYEYKVVAHSCHANGAFLDIADSATKLLNDMAADGWEYVNSISANAAYQHAYLVFRRIKDERERRSMSMSKFF